MTDSSLEAAAARLRAKPQLIDTLKNEANTLATIAARRHPLGHELIYAEVNNGLRAAECYPNGPHRLLAVERVHAAMLTRQEEADAEVERCRVAHAAMALERTKALMTGGVRPPRDPALIEAIFLAKRRLDTAWPKLGDDSEDDFRAVLADIESAMKALGSMVGLARRSSLTRTRNEAAASAVAAAKTALPPASEAA